MSCKDYIKWSGLWKCTYITPEQRKQEAAKKCSATFNAEVMKISTAYRKERREAAKRRAIQEARARAKYKRENAGGSPLVK